MLLRIMIVIWSKHLRCLLILTFLALLTLNGVGRLQPSLLLVLSNSFLLSYVIVLVTRIIIPFCILVFLFLVLTRRRYHLGRVGLRHLL